MLLLLLLDEGSAITFAVFLIKAIPVVALYVVALFFLLYKPRTSELKPIGVIISCLLAYIGFRLWPTHHPYREYNYASLFAACFLFFPLLLAGIVYFASREPAKKKLLVSGVPLMPEDLDELQALLVDNRVEIQALETTFSSDLVQLKFKEFNVATLKPGGSLSELMQPVYTQLKPLIARILHK